MANFTCLIEEDGEQCGFAATCIDEECVCDSGYFRLTDLLVEPEIDCYGNVLAFYLLYGFALVVVVFTTLFYALSIKKKSQFKRLIPFFFTMALCLVLPILKFISVEEFAVGDDVLATVTLTLCFVFNGLSITVFLYKYVKSHYRYLLIFSPDERKKLTFKRNVLFFINAITILDLPVIFVALAVKDVETKQLLVRIWLGAAAVHAVMMFLLVKVLIGDLMKSLKELMVKSQSRQKDYKTAVYVMIGIRRVVLTMILVNTLSFALMAAVDEAFALGGYLLPLLIYCCSLGCLGALYYTRGKRHLRRMMGKTRPKKPKLEDASTTEAIVYHL